jgi:hypothetical protein
MMATLRRFMTALLPDNAEARSLPETRDRLFRIALENWNVRTPHASKKEARPSRPGIPCSLRRNIVRKAPKNNGLLARFRQSPRHCWRELLAIGLILPDIAVRG